jgi:hypothetical protein
MTEDTSNPLADAGPADESSAGTPVPAAYVIPRELAQATLNYLAAQPYREVFGLVAAFEGLEPVSEAEGSRAPGTG